ncbi:MAG: hypothetical protein OEZ47_15465 [Gammaproteobacteria bacterium]|nr:hypothetical protein [Gammaproteobacteria bacterium]
MSSLDSSVNPLSVSAEEFARTLHARIAHLDESRRLRALKGVMTFWLQKKGAASNSLAEFDSLLKRSAVGNMQNWQQAREKTQSSLDAAVASSPTVPAVEPNPENSASSYLPSSDVLARLQSINRLCSAPAQDSTDLDELLQNIEQNIQIAYSQLQEATGKRRYQNYSLPQLAAIASQTVTDSEEALNEAARESFDRILSSVNPDSVLATMEKSKVKIGPFQKAAQLDAISEKYSQLNLYHERGRLVRDFKSIYKSFLSKMRKRQDI